MSKTHQSGIQRNGIGFQNQQQIYQQSQIQQQSEIRYYVYQDLQNIINLIYSRNAVLEHFQNYPNHPMVTLINNKILLQLNLSNTIHFCLQQENQKNRNLSNFLIQQRMNANRILKNVIDSNKQQKNQSLIYQNNQKQMNSLENELQKYKYFYESQNFQLNQFQLQETGLAAKFDESVFPKIFDQQINQLNNGQLQDITSEKDIIKRAELQQQKVINNLYQRYPNKFTQKFQTLLFG
ncbi:unnamed protein product [Paramecium sonneborni]|uniref:Uncharacterized protein n=1 Tax=Paramecium sonneborni TaxID=65129 RepID=A0A8S1RK72_9CILI|nr:unnamed protein product [Paramecium sonneborni]